MIIISPSRAELISGDEFAEAALLYFGEHGQVLRDPAVNGVDVTVEVAWPRQPGFLIDRDGDGTMVSCDGTREQDAAVAAWVRSLLPEDFPRVIGFDQGWGWHVELVHGITPDRVLSERVSHADPDWAAGDPDLA